MLQLVNDKQEKFKEHTHGNDNDMVHHIQDVSVDMESRSRDRYGYGASVVRIDRDPERGHA